MASRMVVLPEPVMPVIKKMSASFRGVLPKSIQASSMEAMFMISSFLIFMAIGFLCLL